MQLRRILIGIAGLLLLSHTSAPAEPARDAHSALPEGVGVLVMAHGGNAAWNEAVEAAVDPLRQRYPIEIAYGMARVDTLQAAANRLEARGVRRVAVVRLFISGESFLERTEVILGLREPPHDAHNHHADHHDAHEGEGEGDGAGHMMTPPTPIETSLVFHLSDEGVSESPLVDEVLAARVQALSEAPARESVLLLAHGPADDAENARWLGAMQERMRRLHSVGDFADLRAETLREDWPERRADAERRIRGYVQRQASLGRRVIVVPFRVAGFGPYASVLKGLDYAADGRGFCPHPVMTQWIDHTARRLAERMPDAGAPDAAPAHSH